MQIIKDIDEMTACGETARAKGETVVLVPTMGFLHAGHVKLIETGKRQGSLLVLSIFVNPAQFGPKEDFNAYPRDIERDLKTAKEAGVDVVFIPDAAGMYRQGSRTFVTVEGLSERLCGRARPGHFKGVATVVLKLFNIVRPHKAVFGKKDFQQFVIIKRLAEDLNAGVEIVGVDTVREEDGLALSSRNTYLSPEERRAACAIPRALQAARQAAECGQRQSLAIIEKVREIIAKERVIAIEYVEICDPMTLEDVRRVEKEALLAVAARVGRTRLIDNTLIA
ncbi:MAG: pantoate--beta-alanine ligase [Deltaproteobacteria bacterium]|nr:pantoate--beta-alanine ligase [Deltaproteobacteria bacterium]